MWCKTSSILISFVVIAVSGNCALGECPSADLTGDCFVDYEDFAVMAGQWLTGDPCIPDDMAYIPGGTFEMGDSFGEGVASERPVHTVTLDSFLIGKYKVSNQQYCDFLNWADDNGWITVTDDVVYQASSGTSYSYCDTHSANIYSQIDYSGGVFTVRSKAGRSMANDPMVMMSWYGAAAYCNWRSQQEGYESCYDIADPNWECDFSKRGYRLATEAEWEYAARGGEHDPYYRFPWGDTISHSQANYYSGPGFPYDVSPTRLYHPDWDDGIYPYTSVVGSFSPNGYGLYDMSGNVWEWCNDWYQYNYYTGRPNPDVNPSGPVDGSYRVIRGGGWDDYAYACRVAYRDLSRPDCRCINHGFRLVLDLE